MEAVLAIVMTEARSLFLSIYEKLLHAGNLLLNHI